MKIYRSLLALFMVMASAAVAHAITVDEIIEKNLQARGGVDKIKALKSFKSTGTISLGGQEIEFTQYMKRERKMRMEMAIMGTSIITGFDGTNGWSVNPMTGSDKATALPAEQAKMMSAQADFDGEFVDWKKKGTKIEYVGTVDVDGASAYKLKITDKDGDVRHSYIDVTNNLELKTEMTTDYQGQKMVVEVVFSNHKPIGGIMVPWSIDVRSQGQSAQSLTIKDVKPNIDIPDMMFMMP